MCYGRVVTDEKALKPLKAEVLGIFGTKDEGIPIDNVRKFAEAAKKADKKVTIKEYEAGMDLGLSDDLEESFELFQGLISGKYEEMVEEFGLQVIDATRSIEEQQNEVRAIVERELIDVPKRPLSSLAGSYPNFLEK